LKSLFWKIKKKRKEKRGKRKEGLRRVIMKHGLSVSVIIAVLALSGCGNYFHELIPSNDNKILSFTVPGQEGESVITEDSVTVIAEADTDIRSLIPAIVISDKATLIPLTLAYIQAAFPSAQVFARAAELYTSDDFADHIFDLISKDKNFKAPELSIPIDFSSPVDFLVISGRGSIRRYTATLDTGEPISVKIPVTITGLSAEDKIYDGTTTATISGTALIEGLESGDEVSVNYGTAAFESADIGNDKTVTFSGFSLDGADAEKYALAAQPESVTANITGIPLSINGLGAANKVYDGTTTATIIGTAVLNGVINGDTVTLNYGTAAFADKNVGNNKTVSFNDFSVGGADAGKYSLTQPANVTANITPYSLTGRINISRAWVSPIPGDNTIEITQIIPPGETDTLSVTFIPALPSGLSYNSGTRRITYNGTTAFTNPNVSFSVVAGNGNYSSNGTIGFGISVYDGQVDFTGTGYDRRIPVTPANITAFNTYANTANGLTRHYKLEGNITLTGTNNWTAIGTLSTQFTGSFDGQLNTITGININRPNEDYKGFFGYISGVSSSVRNLGMVGGSITGGEVVGGVVGYNYGGTVQNCYATGAVSGLENEVGGVVGCTYDGTVQNCYATGAVNGDGYIGGVVGYNNGGTVQNCYATGAVNGDGYIGGVVGSTNRWNGMVRNCYATGAVNNSGYRYIGGVAGYNLNGSTVQNCVALNPSVRLVGSDYIGRVVGENGIQTSSYNNYARNPMMVQYNWNGTTGTNKTINAGANTVDGTSITTTNALTATWWTAAGRWSIANGGTAWDFTNVWNPPDGTSRLPTLRNMPAGTQNPVIQN
jgi:hypothetical protein